MGRLCLFLSAAIRSNLSSLPPALLKLKESRDPSCKAVTSPPLFFEICFAVFLRLFGIVEVGID